MFVNRRSRAKSGLSQKTLYRWLEDADFLKEYRNARRRVVENSITQLQHATSEAVETLKRNLHCENPQAEIRSAQIILDNAFKGIEMMDILDRLEVLENENEKQTETNRKKVKF